MTPWGGGLCDEYVTTMCFPRAFAIPSSYIVSSRLSPRLAYTWLEARNWLNWKAAARAAGAWYGAHEHSSEKGPTYVYIPIFKP